MNFDLYVKRMNDSLEEVIPGNRRLIYSEEDTITAFEEKDKKPILDYYKKISTPENLGFPLKLIKMKHSLIALTKILASLDSFEYFNYRYSLYFWANDVTIKDNKLFFQDKSYNLRRITTQDLSCAIKSTFVLGPKYSLLKLIDSNLENIFAIKDNVMYVRDSLIDKLVPLITNKLFRKNSYDINVKSLLTSVTKFDVIYDKLESSLKPNQYIMTKEYINSTGIKSFKYKLNVPNFKRIPIENVKYKNVLDKYLEALKEDILSYKDKTDFYYFSAIDFKYFGYIDNQIKFLYPFIQKYKNFKDLQKKIYIIYNEEDLNNA